MRRTADGGLILGGASDSDSSGDKSEYSKGYTDFWVVKMSAGFNMLDIFLKSFPKSNNPDVEDPASTLMRAFVKNLEKSDGIEDGVDVADSYASIAETLKPLADQMLKNIQDNYKTNLAAGNKKGIAIYNILNKLFLSADSTQNIDLTKELSIPPIYEVPYSALTYDSNGPFLT